MADDNGSQKVTVDGGVYMDELSENAKAQLLICNLVMLNYFSYKMN